MRRTALSPALVRLGLLLATSASVGCVFAAAPSLLYYNGLTAMPSMPAPATEAEWAQLAATARAEAATCAGCQAGPEARLVGKFPDAKVTFPIVAGRCYTVGAAWKADLKLSLMVAPAPMNSNVPLDPRRGHAQPVCPEEAGTLSVQAMYIAPGGAAAFSTPVEIAVAIAEREETEEMRAARHAAEEDLAERSRARAREVDEQKREEACRERQTRCYHEDGGLDCVNVYARCMGKPH